MRASLSRAPKNDFQDREMSADPQKRARSDGVALNLANVDQKAVRTASTQAEAARPVPPHPIDAASVPFSGRAGNFSFQLFASGLPMCQILKRAMAEIKSTDHTVQTAPKLAQRAKRAGLVSFIRSDSVHSAHSPIATQSVGVDARAPGGRNYRGLADLAICPLEGGFRGNGRGPP